MIYNQIELTDISLTFTHKACFTGFSTTVPYGARISIIGNNGGGKSTLLRSIADSGGYSCNNTSNATIIDGKIEIAPESSVGYVPQVIGDHDTLSGGERFNRVIGYELGKVPDILLLDEPTNHLDRRNRKGLMRMLDSYYGTLIIVSHDVELISRCTDVIWHINNGLIDVFCGDYRDYVAGLDQKRSAIQKKISDLKHEKKESHESLMCEQVRASKSKKKGEKKIRNSKTSRAAIRGMEDKASHTAGRKRKEIMSTRADLAEQLSDMRVPEVIRPTFTLPSSHAHGDTVVSISEGRVAYGDVKCRGEVIVDDISFSISGGDRVAIMGDNGSGKSTFIKAIMGDESVRRSGNWYAPQRSQIGYLDQHYSNISQEESVLDHIKKLRPEWSDKDVRHHLGKFLFRKNEEVSSMASLLSGGERARLTLAQISAKTPSMLVLDEVTNNLDLEARSHVIQVLSEYHGTIIAISHDEDFLDEISIKNRYLVKGGKVRSC